MYSMYAERSIMVKWLLLDSVCVLYVLMCNYSILPRILPRGLRRLCYCIARNSLSSTEPPSFVPKKAEMSRRKNRHVASARSRQVWESVGGHLPRRPCLLLGRTASLGSRLHTACCNLLVEESFWSLRLLRKSGVACPISAEWRFPPSPYGV